ncbi:MAG: hypothetical protein WA901_01150 [Phormidesmis sp.]
MPKKQSLEKHPQQHQLDAYGGIEAVTSRRFCTGSTLEQPRSSGYIYAYYYVVV